MNRVPFHILPDGLLTPGAYAEIDSGIDARIPEFTRDPFFSYVKALLHFDGNLTDSGPLALPYTARASATITSSAQMFGSGALDCRATSSDLAFTQARPGLAIAAQDFCFEFLANDTNAPARAPGGNFFFFQGSSGQCGINSNSSGTFVPQNAGGSGFANQAYSFNVFNHFAFVRSGNTAYVYLNGVQTHTWSCAGFTFGAGVADLWIGGASSAASGLALIVDDFRLTVGVPRYTGPFTPPSAPFPNR